MKYLIAALISAICVQTGIKKAKALSDNRLLIASVLTFLGECERQITYYTSTVEEILTGCTENRELNRLTFIPECLKLLSTFDFPVAWETAVRSFEWKKGRDCTELLVNFGKSLGTTGCDEQVKMIACMRERFNDALKEATEKEEKNKRLYLIFSVSLGIIIFLVII